MWLVKKKRKPQSGQRSFGPLGNTRTKQPQDPAGQHMEEQPLTATSHGQTVANPTCFSPVREEWEMQCVYPDVCKAFDTGL